MAGEKPRDVWKGKVMLANCVAKPDRARGLIKCDICKLEWEMGDLTARCPRAEDKPMEGRKDDQAKVRMELIPPELFIAVGDILTSGAQKYSDRNWEHGMKWSRVYGALLRHLTAWWCGENTDPETGRSHLWHVACCVTFLLTYEMRGAGEDDRPTGEPRA